MRASVIVPAYNEEQNIGSLLRRLVADRAADSTIDDIVLVASGCTDRTVAEAEVVAQAARDIRIVEQADREGKAAAINVALTLTRHDNVVLVSGDVLPAPGTISKLLRGLDDPQVGAVGGRPVPMNDQSTFAGFAANLLWRLHHDINELMPEHPKCGEMIAFRKRMGEQSVVPAIAADSAVDEVDVQALVHRAGLRSHYAGDAIVHTWGPSSVSDWFKQRRRINAGHLVYSKLGYTPSTMKLSLIVKAFRSDPLLRRRPLWTAAVIALEAAARVAGRLDLLRGEKHTIWNVANSTKRRLEPAPAADEPPIAELPEIFRQPAVNGHHTEEPGTAPATAVAMAAANEEAEDA